MKFNSLFAIVSFFFFSVILTNCTPATNKDVEKGSSSNAKPSRFKEEEYVEIHIPTGHIRVGPPSSFHRNNREEKMPLLGLAHEFPSSHTSHIRPSKKLGEYLKEERDAEKAKEVASHKATRIPHQNAGSESQKIPLLKGHNKSSKSTSP